MDSQPTMDLPTCQVGQILDLVVVFDDQGAAPIDLSDATNLKVRIEQPNGTSAEATGTLYADGLDGAIFFHTTVDDLPYSGIVKIQGFATVQGENIKTEVGQIYVKPDANSPGSVVITAPVYIGSPSADGSWRFRTVGVDLIIERREGGVWIQKGSYNP